MPVYDRYLKLLAEIEKNPKSWKKRCRGKWVVDWKKLCPGASPKIRSAIKNFYSRTKKIESFNRNYLKELDAEGKFVRYVSYREEFAKTLSRSDFDALADEIRRLQILGRPLRGNASRLQHRYHVRKKILDDLWNWSAELLTEEMKGWTPQDLKLARWWYQWQESMGEPEELPKDGQEGREITAEE